MRKIPTDRGAAIDQPKPTGGLPEPMSIYFRSVTSTGQLTLPAKLRRKLGIREILSEGRVTTSKPFNNA